MDAFSQMKRLILTLVILLAASCGGGSGGGRSEDLPGPAPGAAPGTGGSTLDQWQSNMLQHGRRLCDAQSIFDLGTWEGNIWYYDGIRVYYQIADFTGDESWERCAQYAWSVYGRYVLDNNGRVPGWRVFPHGLQLDFQRTGNQDSRTAALLLASNSAFADTGGGADTELSRETAYLIHAYITQRELGGGQNPNLAAAVQFSLGHLDAWTGAQSAGYVKPFMVGLTFEGLIHYYESTGKDVRVLNAVQIAADWLWDNAWNAQAQAFEYIVCKPAVASSNQECSGPDAGPAPDLNLLVGPGYAWLYSETRDPMYRDRAQAIFDGGVRGADLATGKQFNQNYRWSFDLLKWLGSQ